MTGKNKSELVKQIEAYGLKSKLADLAHKEQARRPFRHLPKQFSKGILIGNIAIVPKKHTGTRYVYVIADMMEAKVLNEDMSTSHKSSQKTIIATAGTVVAGLLSTVVVILMKMPG